MIELSSSHLLYDLGENVPLFKRIKTNLPMIRYIASVIAVLIPFSFSTIKIRTFKVTL